MSFDYSTKKRLNDTAMDTLIRVAAEHAVRGKNVRAAMKSTLVSLLDGASAALAEHYGGKKAGA